MSNKKTYATDLLGRESCIPCMPCSVCQLVNIKLITLPKEWLYKNAKEFKTDGL